MSNVKTVVGFQKGTSKTNNPFTVLHMIGSFEDYQTNTKGNLAENVYVRGDLNVSVGDKVSLEYQPGFQGKAMVSGINIIEPATVGGK